MCRLCRSCCVHSKFARARPSTPPPTSCLWAPFTCSSSPTLVHLSTLNYARILEEQSIRWQKALLQRHASHALWRPPVQETVQPSLLQSKTASLSADDSQVMAAQVRPPPLRLSTTAAPWLWAHKAASTPNKGSSHRLERRDGREAGEGESNFRISSTGEEPALGQPVRQHLNTPAGDTPSCLSN